MAPIPRVGVRRGSKAGIDARMMGHQGSGTGGATQWAGSLLAAGVGGHDQRARWDRAPTAGPR